jgi:hypothetical protein
MEWAAPYFFWMGVLCTIGAFLAFCKVIITLKEVGDAHTAYYAFKYEQSRRKDL